MNFVVESEFGVYRALRMYFGQKACMMHSKSIEALLLKGNLLLDMKKLHHAMDHFREAVTVASYR